MLRAKAACFTVLLGTVIFAQSGRAQAGFVGGLYQITSGSFTECCGIAGEINHNLPYSGQSFVKLTIDSESGFASMTFLA